MKKNLIKIFIGLFIIAIIIGSMVYLNNQKDPSETSVYKVAGITKSPLYLPVFVGIEKGYFENLDVEYINTTGGDIANTMLLSGEIDAVLNSLNIVINSTGDDNAVLAIGELTHRGGMTLISKVPFADIETIVSAKNGGLPNMILAKTTNYKIVANLSPQEGVTYFLNQDVDAIMAFEPFATQLKNQGYKAQSLNSYYENIPFNCVLIKKANLNNTNNKKFMLGLQKSIDYIKTTDSKEITNEVKEIMEFKDVDVLASIIETFKNDEVWNYSLELSEAEYNYYIDFANMKKVSYDSVYKNIMK